jgi:hypothetical protein
MENNSLAGGELSSNQLIFFIYADGFAKYCVEE